MSFNNGPYIFSDVHGYEASKGERLVPSCNINMNNLGSTDIASEVVVSDTRDVEIADILVGMPAETVNVTCEVNEEQPLISLQPLLDATSQGIILQPQEEIVGADSESEGLSAYEHIPVSTSDVILDSSSGQANKRGRKDIVKAFQKLWAKINHLEQTKVVEKVTTSQEVQANIETDLTMGNIKYELLLTQLRYIIKILRESANNKSQNSLDKGCYEMSTDPNLVTSTHKCDSIHKDSTVQQEDQKDCLVCSPISKITAEASRHEDRERNINGHQVSTTGTQTSKKVNASDTSEKLLPNSSKQDSHYHLKLDDVPFILGASATASHSVVANVQNIIALMKNHNKALCAPKPHAQKEANAGKLHKVDTEDTNKMIQELSEDLTKLNVKHEKIMARLDNVSPHSIDPQVQTSQRFDMEGGKKCEIPIDPGHTSSTSTFQKNFKQLSKKNSGNQVRHIVPTVRMKTNDNPQLARRKMLRSLKDFKTHLSEEDLFWK